MEKKRIAIIQTLDDNIYRKSGEQEIQNILTLSLNLKKWSEFHGYDHFIHYLTDDYKKSQEFLTLTYNDYTKIHSGNIDQNGHGKLFGFSKSLECLESGDYDYVCMLDMDIGFVKWDRNIEEYIEVLNLQEKHIVAGLECVDPKEYFGGRYPNGGVYLFKNTDWTKRLLTGLIAAQTRVGYSNHRLATSMNDQMQMSFLAMICPDCDENFAILDHYNSIQLWYNAKSYEFVEQTYKSPFYHFAGHMKVNIPQYYKMLKSKGLEVIDTLDNYELHTVKH